MGYKLKLIAAFTGIYVVWGSTYLAIRFVVETLPPLLSAGLRFVIAGAILYAFVRIKKKVPPPRKAHWRSAFIIGGFLLLGGNGNVVLAERYVPSGLAALFLATTPLWMVVLDWLWFRAKRPSWEMWAGVGLGFIGVGFLIAPDLTGMNAHHVHPWGAAGLLAAALLWTIGSLYARKADLPSSGLMATAMEMVGGGILMVLAGVLLGEITLVNPQAFSVKSVIAFFYLIFFGSLWGFTSYIWLLEHVGAVRASTNAFVNPVVAVFLGWALAGEKLNPQTLVAVVCVVAAVMIITFSQAKVQRS